MKIACVLRSETFAELITFQIYSDVMKNYGVFQRQSAKYHLIYLKFFKTALSYIM